MPYQTAKGYIQFILIIVFLGLIYSLNFGLELLKTEPQIQSEKNDVKIVNTVTINATMEKISWGDTAQIIVRNYIPITPQITGRIVYIAPNFKKGLCFEKNQILFKIDSDQTQARYDTALAELEQAKANLSLVTAEANAATEEWKILNPTQAIPPLVAKEPQIKQATANIDTAKAKVKLAGVDLKHAQFSYPFAGCIESSNADIGQYANTGQSLGQVFSQDSLEISVNLPMKKAEKLKQVPFDAKIVVDDVAYNATIDRISDVVDSQTQFTQVILKPTDTKNLQPNKIGTVTFSTTETQKVFILTDADIVNNNQIRIVDLNNQITFKTVDIVGYKNTAVYVRAFDNNIKIIHGVYPDLKNGMIVKADDKYSKLK